MSGLISAHDFMEYLALYYDKLNEHHDSDFVEFKSEMLSLRQFLGDFVLEEKNKTVVFDEVTKKKEYVKYKSYFTHAEMFFERQIEIQENEAITKLNMKLDMKKIRKYLTKDFNKLFYDTVGKEIDELSKYFDVNSKFLMVGCGSMPISLLHYTTRYPNSTFIGIDNSSEAIGKAIELKNKLKIKNLRFSLYDGVAYDKYGDIKTILVANTVIPKKRIMNKITQSAGSNTIIFMRIPVDTGHLLSEDVNYTTLGNRIELLEEIDPYKVSGSPDDLLYKIQVLKIK